MSRGTRGTLSPNARPCRGQAAWGRSRRRVLAVGRAQVAVETMVPIHGAWAPPPPQPPRGRRLQPDSALAPPLPLRRAWRACVSLPRAGWGGGLTPRGSRRAGAGRRLMPCTVRSSPEGRQPGTSRSGEGAGIWQARDPCLPPRRERSRAGRGVL